MPLALTGFALKSVPLRDSTALLSSLVTFFTACGNPTCHCRRVDKWLIGKSMSEDKVNPTHTQ
jgi:hypothetical protein